MAACQLPPTPAEEFIANTTFDEHETMNTDDYVPDLTLRAPSPGTWIQFTPANVDYFHQSNTQQVDLSPTREDER